MYVCVYVCMNTETHDHTDCNGSANESLMVLLGQQISDNNKCWVLYERPVTYGCVCISAMFMCANVCVINIAHGISAAVM